jgi:hypothetical protein
MTVGQGFRAGVARAHLAFQLRLLRFRGALAVFLAAGFFATAVFVVLFVDIVVLPFLAFRSAARRISADQRRRDMTHEPCGRGNSKRGGVKLWSFLPNLTTRDSLKLAVPGAQF